MEYRPTVTPRMKALVGFLKQSPSFWWIDMKGRLRTRGAHGLDPIGEAYRLSYHQALSLTRYRDAGWELGLTESEADEMALASDNPDPANPIRKLLETLLL